MEEETKARAAEVARASYGKLLAALAKQTSDIALAEDALAEAFARALEAWPKGGVPSSPEAWLLTTARNKMRDHYKSAAHKSNTSLNDENSIEPAMHDLDPHNIPDERLKLLFVCAHPAIDEAIRTPLMLQTVLGLEAAQIAKAFLIPTTAMAQRLVRAKKKIKASNIPFVIPEKNQMQSRLEAVLEAIYGAFAIDISYPNKTEDIGLEALFLADILVELLPDEAEVLGLAALLNYAASRRYNRTEFVPLSQQDPNGWNQPRQQRADNLLSRAKHLNQLGRFQLEAAIQSVHSARRITGETDWRAIVQLYEGLLHMAPTLGAAVAQAAAIGEAYGAEAGLSRLDQLNAPSIQNHQPAWASRAHFLSQLGEKEKARLAFKQAIKLTTNVKMKAYLELKMAQL